MGFLNQIFDILGPIRAALERRASNRRRNELRNIQSGESPFAVGDLETKNNKIKERRRPCLPWNP